MAPRSEGFDPFPNQRYTSILFWRLARALDPEAPPSRILDLGPTAHANIRFWAELGYTVTCHDVVRREAARLGDAPSLTSALTREKLRRLELPYPEDAFSAVCAWNVFSQLPSIVAQRYVRECYRILAPSGLLHAVCLDAAAQLDGWREYRVADRKQLDVISRSVSRTASPELVEAELTLLFARFDATEVKAAPCQTREVLAQKAPTDNFPA